jgi:urease accessory protein
MQHMRRILFPVLSVALIFPGFAQAHTGAGTMHDALHGLLHPLTGLDHILAMVSVGLLAAQRGGRALWLLPLCFVTMMAAGGVLAVAGVALPGAESIIGISVIALGALILSGSRIHTGLATALIGAFAVFHGQAHGAEMPATAAAIVFGLGFITATALLHGAGIGLYFALTRGIAAPSAAVARALGAAIVLAGATLLFSVA